ncbi:bifunctional solanapyrone synthase [Podospora fimiseda]|uniref:Bifunctional solanapyrone synthase n=1 Tax=Podospora fimiseda TaxID=252190 RepID=A0AAN6YMY1_9PEZI|nr:bifunctional solanapyrone synthase [Podospora fimiseda]
MARITGLLSLLTLATGSVEALNSVQYIPVCQQIQSKVSSSSNLVWPIQALSYKSSTQHWFLSSDDTPACVIKVNSPQDVSEVLKVIAATRTPFAVYSGGHASNPGFSSTPGIHIDLANLNQIILSPDKSTVEIGFGLTWNEVYQDLIPQGVNVVGGRVIGPGVGGFTLGGGFSWKTNQYGLTVDTVIQFNLVLPNGTITTASSTTNPDLFFALKGGLNRFGIVTSAILQTHTQSPLVYGGLRIYPTSSVPQVMAATQTFYSNQSSNPQSQIITTLDGGPLGTTALVLFFHDGPSKPVVFNAFDGIPYLSSTTGLSSFTTFLTKFPSYIVRNLRGRFATISTSGLTPGFMAAIKNQTDYLGVLPKALNSGTSLSYDIEPFNSYGQYATDSAYPHSDSPLPLNLYFAWASPLDDQFWHDTMRQALNDLKQVAIAEGIWSDTFTAYPNYAINSNTAEEVYGVANTARLRAIKAQIDPTGIMDLAGGFGL